MRKVRPLPRAPPKALVTKEMLASVRPKSRRTHLGVQAFLHLRSRQPKLGIDGHRIFGCLTPRVMIEEENTGGSTEVDDLLPDREGVDLLTDTFNDGEGPTEAEVLEFT